MSYRDAQVLVALAILRVTGMVKIDDVEMSELTGLKRQDLLATYRNLKSMSLIDYNPIRASKTPESWVALTKTGRKTAGEALQATLATKTITNTTMIKEAPGE